MTAAQQTGEVPGDPAVDPAAAPAAPAGPIDPLVLVRARIEAAAGRRNEPRIVSGAEVAERLERALGAGRLALEHSAEAIQAVGSRFDSVGPALALLLSAPGRVVVTGLGKSGHVGAKLAATLASTGTPAFFVHAADALHGDAGMVADDDVLLAISKSGETAEVCQFAEMVLRRGAFVIAMTGCDGGSTLCSLADARLDASVHVEADPYDLVPSTSTQVAAALGDALAVALMVARNFGPDDFYVHHPAGSLGDRLREGETHV